MFRQWGFLWALGVWRILTMFGGVGGVTQSLSDIAKNRQQCVALMAKGLPEGSVCQEHTNEAWKVIKVFLYPADLKYIGQHDEQELKNNKGRGFQEYLARIHRQFETYLNHHYPENKRCRQLQLEFCSSAGKCAKCPRHDENAQDEVTGLTGFVANCETFRSYLERLKDNGEKIDAIGGGGANEEHPGGSSDGVTVRGPAVGLVYSVFTRRMLSLQ